MQCIATQFLRTVSAFSTIAFLMHSPAHAKGRQSEEINELRIQVAGLQQDMESINHRLGQFRLEVEVVRNQLEDARRCEQAAIIRQNQLIENYNAFVQNTRAELQHLRDEMARSDERQKREIIDIVTRQLEKMGSQTQRALDSMAKSGSSVSGSSTSFQFSDNYPKEGVAYTVQPGDTLSTIARKHGSTIRDIQNANKIANPKDLKAGQTIFIPQRQG